MARCIVQGCSQEVSREGHTLCLAHWKAQRAGKVKQCATCGKWIENIATVCQVCEGHVPVMVVPDDSQDTRGMLSSTKLGKHFGFPGASPSSRMNLVLAELGWIEKFVKGWVPSEQGRKLGAVQREMRENGVPYVIWPASIVENKALLDAIREVRGDVAEEQKPIERPAAAAATSAAKRLSTQEFREKFPAKHRATDGHMVRSRGEMLIDNWLYMQLIAHAYERRLPIEEEVISDFYLPKDKVYIEYWGMEKDEGYAARAQAKREIYEKHGYRLVEITDDDIAQLDDVLPKKLLKFGVELL